MQESSLVVWLRRLIYSSALVPLIIFSQYISPFHFGKVMVLRSIVEVMAALYLLLIWRDRSYLPKSHPITWAFLAFTAAFTLTTFTSVAFLQSFWGTLERMGGLWTFWHYFIFYLITVSVLRTKQDWQTLLDMMVSVGLVAALYGFLQRFDISFIVGSGGRERIFGTMGNPALFAGYQILIAYLALTLVLMKSFGPAAGVPRESVNRGTLLIGGGLVVAMVIALLSSPWQWLNGLWIIPFGVVVYGVYLVVSEGLGAGKIFYGGVAALTALAAAMTVVRGSLVAMVVATIVFALLYSTFKHSVAVKRLFLGLCAGVLAFIFLGVLLRNTPLVQNSPYLRRITDFSLTTTTVQTRFWAWSAGFAGWHDTPKTMLVGWGPENFNVPFSKHFNPKFFTGPGAETFFDRAHNMFVEILVTMGAVGEIAYLSIFATLFIALVKLMKRSDDERILGIGFISLTIAYIIHNAFIFDTSANFLTFFMILAFATHVARRGLLGAVPGKAEAVTARPSLWTAGQRVMAMVLMIGVVVLIGITNVQATQANFSLTRAIIAGWQGDFTTAITKYREAIDYDVPGRYEYRHKYTEYLLQIASTSDTSKISNFEQIVLSSVEDVKQNIQENPLDYLPYLYISRLYLTLGKNDAASPYNPLALQYSQKALEISPTFIRTYYEVAQAYLNMKQYDKAFAAFETAEKLNPDVGITWWYMAVVDFTRGRKDEGLQLASQAITRGYELSESDAKNLFGAYTQKGDYATAVIVGEQLVRLVPTTSTYWGQLAAAYLKNNNIPGAIDAARRGIAANPTDTAFRQQAESFIVQLGGER